MRRELQILRESDIIDENKGGHMQHTVKINIPDPLETRVRGIQDFDEFVSTLTIEALQRATETTFDQELVDAANLMLQEYQTNPELTQFTVLDGESIYE
jgi:hypothetical protein